MGEGRVWGISRDCSVTPTGGRRVPPSGQFTPRVVGT
jgi:hypothetical protein